MYKKLLKMEALTFDNFCSKNFYQVFLRGEAADIGGGTITKKELDIIKRHPEWERISIAGLHQDTFEYFVQTYGRQFKAIYFFKNKMVHDLSPLGQLENLEALGYFLNQRAEKLWDMSGNKALEYLNVDDFSRLHSLEGIEKAPNLKYLSFGNKIWARSKFFDVPDLSNSRLKKISFNAEISYENTYKFLQCPDLDELDFRTNLYKTEFLAWICANYPNLTGYCLRPYILFEDGTGLICGKRKPHLDNVNDEKTKEKLAKAEKKFDEMKAKYQGMELQEIIAQI